MERKTKVDPWKVDPDCIMVRKYIFYVPSEDKFYFSDETEQLIGPYESSMAAEVALNKYVAYLNGDSNE